MNELEFRQAMRPGFVSTYRSRRARRFRPIGVHQNMFLPEGGRAPKLPLWHWTCRLDCWAAITSGWYLPSHEKALAEGMEHLYAYHYPEPCLRPGCPDSHAWWPETGTRPGVLGMGYFTDLLVWLPVTPLLGAHVTQSNAA